MPIMTLSTTDSTRRELPQLLEGARSGSPLLWQGALVFLALFIITYAGTFIDDRLFSGVSVWEKPAKFFLSLSLHMATLSWGLALLPIDFRRSRAMRWASIVFLAVA